MGGSKKVVVVLTVLALSLVWVTAAGADNATSVTASSYGYASHGLLDVGPEPSVSVSSAPPDTAPKSAQEEVLNIPADPVAVSGTFIARGEASLVSNITAKLQSLISSNGTGVPGSHNARGYAVVEDLSVLTGVDGGLLEEGGLLDADAVEAEALATCAGGRVVYSTGSRVTDLDLQGQSLPEVIAPEPNQVLLDNANVRVVLWETNWNPATGGTTDGANKVFVNALHVTVKALGDLGTQIRQLQLPGIGTLQSETDIDIITSHAEATGTCAAAEVLPAQELPRTGGGNFYAMGSGLVGAAALALVLGRKLRPIA